MTIGELIRLLSDGDFHSGEQLGERLGVSRTAVWKQLKKLEAMNIPLEAVKGLGYRLADPIELLDGPAIVAELSRDSRQRLARLFIEESLPSTNRFLRERFEQGAGHGEVCLSEAQSAGRGRRGRAWACPWGRGLLLSLGWRFESGAAALEGLSLAVGVALAEVLERLDVEVALKWPNDVLVLGKGSSRKLAGILLEVSGDLSGPCEVVIGLGINVALPDAVREDIDQPAAAVHDQQPGVTRNRLAADLIDALLDLLPRFEAAGFAAWQEAWNARHAHAGQAIDIIQGARRQAAVAEKVDAAGNLVVWQDGVRQSLASGEISVRGHS